MKSITLKTKPVPVNAKYGVIRGKMLLTKDYRSTKEAMQWEVRSQYKGQPLTGDISMNILFYYGDNRKRDIDAYIKILLDAMSKIVYEDDCQIVEMHIYKEKDLENPRTEIQVL